jgi:hypothetical protein
MIGVVEPVANELAERFTPGGTMERMKQKMAQYQEGTLFLIDARSAVQDAVQRLYNELQPWTSERGYRLQIYRN